MKETKDRSPTDRRSFLKMAGFGAVGSVAAATSAVAGEVPEEAPTGTRLYRETEHVKRVYDLSRF